MSVFERLRKQREDKSTVAWNVSFRFAVLSPFLGVLLDILALAIFFR
jgi:hypothetical protein